MASEQRIYGPPGTGKTTKLTSMVAETAAAIGPANIMVASFTTAAASEVAARAPAMPDENIGTLHSFCYHAIGRVPVLEEKKKAIEEWNSREPGYSMGLPGCKDINSGLEYNGHGALGDDLMAHTTILRNRLIPREQWPGHAQAFFEKWQNFKDELCGIDYTDMLEIALHDYPEPPGNPSVIFVDEAQDCTALQFAVLQQWAQSTERLVLVGDDDQCIYQFAGATPEAFARHDLGPEDEVLEQSYRLPFIPWEYACKWISKIHDRVDKQYFPKRGEPGFVKKAPYTWKQGEKIAELTTQCTARQPTVMILAACSYMLEPTIKALRAEGIPFHNPFRQIRADWNPLRLSTGITYAERLSGLLIGAPPSGFPSPTQLKALGAVLSAADVFNKGMKGKLESDIITTVDWNTLNKYFQPAAALAIAGRDTAWWNAHLVNDAARRKATYPLAIAKNLGAGFLESEPAVTVGTIHSIKGGEADIVIIFPDLSVEGMQEWTGKGRSAIRRLMYVGITRAREGVFVCRPASPYACDL